MKGRGWGGPPQAHQAELPYWCHKWHGSAQSAEQFSRTAAAAAPGVLLSVLPPQSWFEHNDTDATRQDCPHPNLVAAVNTLLVDVTEALEQFRHVDGFVGAAP
ncbi:hypothetical protein OG897_27735 [Streptomyces sp. NBC_00237]|uniref:hypothetical protein n=1 Tax=Streptomyces sp. NBC_00237 TaxID=2975687 RepID=UPI002257EC84|nr:hypothetical protein [Streptomyces sp. NBC_00237]MCX5205235.1 hypothetical protein [Streptomyces sp. NBC_00237]